VLGQIFVFVLFLLLSKPGTTGLLFLLGLLHCYTCHSPENTTSTNQLEHTITVAGLFLLSFNASLGGHFTSYFYSPFLKLRRGDEARRAILGILQLSLPPVVVILGDYLDDVT